MKRTTTARATGVSWRERLAQEALPPVSGWDGRHWPKLPVIGAFALLFLAMTWPWVFGLVTIPWDAKAHFQPQIQFLADSIAKGEWPWWNPYVFSGTPHVADPQSMIFSPPFLALALLSRNPSLWAADMTVLAAMLAGGIGLILYARDQGWNATGALVAALVFSFGGVMSWRMQHTGQVLSLAYLPWALLALERAIVQNSTLAGIAAGLVAAAIVLGRDQVALLCIYLLVARALWLLATADDRGATIRGSLVPLTLGGMVGLAAIAVPILMTALLAADSNRPQIDFEGAGRGSLHPALLLTFLLPQLFGAAGHMADYWGPPSFAWPDTSLFIAQNVGQMYVGAVPLLLVLAGAATGRLWDRKIRFFTIAFVVMLFYALGWYTPAFRAMYEVLPGVNLYRRPADGVFLVGALAAVLAGYSVDRLFAAPWERVPTAVLATIAAVIVLAAIAATGLGARLDRVPRLSGPLLGGFVAFSAALAALAWYRSRVLLTPVRAALGLALVTAVDLGWNNGPTTSSALPSSYYEVLEPNTKNPTIALLKDKVVQNATRRDRVELAGLGFHWPNASMTHGLENTLGYNPVRLGTYSRATGAEDHVGLPEQRKFSRLMPSYSSLLAHMLGLRYIATGAPVETIDKQLQPGGLTLLAELPDGHFVYENKRALPRVIFAPESQPADFAAIVAAGEWPAFDPTHTVLLPMELPGTGSDRRAGTIRIRSYANTEVVIEADSPDGGYVLLNDIWHPWWRADLDGATVEILRANVLFRAVAVPAGRHTVTFQFQPLAGLGQALGAERSGRPK